MKIYRFIRYTKIILFIFLYTYSNAFAGRIKDFNDYLDQIEEISGDKIPSKGFLIKTYKSKEYGDKIISNEELKKSHQDFSNRRNNLIKEWEEQTKSSWPKYNEKTECFIDGTCISKNTGWKYDAHHIIPQSHNGPNEWWNLIPLDIRQHNLIHGTPIIINIPIDKVFKSFSKSDIMESGVFETKRSLEPAFCCKIFETSCIIKKFNKTRGEYR